MPRRAEVWRLLQAPPLGLGELPSLCFVPLLLLCDAWLRARARPATSRPCIRGRSHTWLWSTGVRRGLQAPVCGCPWVFCGADGCRGAQRLR